MEHTITLEQLWLIFSKLQKVSYGVDIEIKPGFKANPEMIFYSLQKELYAHSRLGMN